MANTKLDRWIGVVGNLAVVIGLVVVAVELRQTSVIANGELSSEFMANWQEFDRSRQDPSFAAVYAKSIERPDELTLTEQIQLDAHYWSAMNQLELARMLVEAGLFNHTYERILQENVRSFMTTPYAQAWWTSYRDRFADSTTAAIVDRELAAVPPETARDFFRAIESKLDE